MITYNHERFIGTAVKSVLSQQTEYPFELVIGEDNSPDSTGEKVDQLAAAFPHIIKVVRAETNLGVAANFCKTFNACSGKYMAILDGDDFWTDPLKLQKQVSFMEANPEYGLVHADVNHLSDDTGILVQAYNKANGIEIPQGSIFQELMAPEHRIKTMTTCFRKDLVDNHFDFNLVLERNWLLLDLPLWLDISSHSKVHYMDEVFATYRLLNESISRSQSVDKKFRFYMSVYDVFDHYTQKYNCNSLILGKIDQYKFKTLLKFSLLYSDAGIIKRMVNTMRSGNRRLNLYSELINALVVNKLMFGVASKLYNKYRALR
jgi:glycosyltransferase involved in cell wall biosynthesis